MRFTNIIQQWFKDEWGGSLMLPDGWYGRPYDSQHALTSIDELDDVLTLVLSKKLTLRFNGLKLVTNRDHNLVFGPFDTLRFEWEGFGNDGTQGFKEYRMGEAKIMRAPGR